MVEGNIISLVGKFGISLLDRMVEDLIHTGDIGARADNRRQILQCPLQRVVKPRYDKQEQKEGQHVNATTDQQDGARQRNRGNSQL